MFVGEAPGEEEDRTGEPFVGRSGKELNRFLNGYLLPRRDEVFVTNLVRERPPHNRDPKPEEIARDEPDLLAEIAAVQPEVVVTLGRFSTRWFLGRDAAIEAVRGFPFPVKKAGHRCVVWPTYHPAAGLRDPIRHAAMAQDLYRLSAYLRGEGPTAPPDDQLAGREEYAYAAPTRLDRVVAVDTEGTPDRPWGLSWSCAPGMGYVIHAHDTARLQQFRDRLRKDRPRVVLHNALYDLLVLRAMGIDLADADLYDTMVAAYVLGLEPQGLKALAYRHAGMHMREYRELVGPADEAKLTAWLTEQIAATPDRRTAAALKRFLTPAEASLRDRLAQSSVVARCAPLPPPATLDDVDPAVALQYSARDADATLRVYFALEAKIRAAGLENVLAADLAVLPMIDRMQHVGLLADTEYFTLLAQAWRLEAEGVRQQLVALAGDDAFDPNSSQQVMRLLFDRLGLRPRKRTKTGRPSTQDKVLDALSKHPETPSAAKQAIALVQEYRELVKLAGTYAEQIPTFVRPATGRLHPRYKVTRTATGRLAAEEPNLLAFPKHSVRGKMIREGVTAGEGRVLGSWDLDQVEMRVMAIASRDEQMIREFLAGVDKHRATASLLFGKPPEAIDAEERFAAKAVNFGILMGISEHGLVEQFHRQGQLWTIEQCRDLLTDWHRAYPQASRYIAAKHAEARRYGYVTDLFGRRRYLEGVHSTDALIQAEALRQAQATPIQSGAQGIEKRLMAAVWRRLPELWAAGVWVEPLLQIHDDLLFEVDEWAWGLLDEVITSTLAALHDDGGPFCAFPVPITAKGSYGRRWSDL